MNQVGSKMIGLAVRTILALAAVGCTFTAYRYAEVAALSANAPLEAAKIAPQNAKVVANALGRRFDSNPEFKPSTNDLSDIRAALRAQLLEPKLLSFMGLAYEAAGDKKRAADAMRVANLTSRRDSVSGLYLIESASASGDVKETLRHYNAVLSTQPEFYNVLLPILSSALAYPEVRTELRQYLQAGPRWLPAFLNLAAEKGSVNDLAAFLVPLPKPLLREEYTPIMAGVVHRLAIEGDRANALRFAVAAIPGFSPTSLSKLGPEPVTLDKRLGQFAWAFAQIGGIHAEVNGNKSLQINVDPLVRGVAAARDLLLEAGSKYQLVQRLEYSSGSRSIDARWSAACITPVGSTPFWDQRLPASGSGGYYRSEFVVPQGCKIVRMSLFVEGPDGQIPASLVLSDLLLLRFK